MNRILLLIITSFRLKHEGIISACSGLASRKASPLFHIWQAGLRSPPSTSTASRFVMIVFYIWLFWTLRRMNEEELGERQGGIAQATQKGLNPQSHDSGSGGPAEVKDQAFN